MTKKQITDLAKRFKKSFSHCFGEKMDVKAWVSDETLTLSSDIQVAELKRREKESLTFYFGEETAKKCLSGENKTVFIDPKIKLTTLIEGIPKEKIEEILRGQNIAFKWVKKAPFIHSNGDVVFTLSKKEFLSGLKSVLPAVSFLTYDNDAYMPHNKIRLNGGGGKLKFSACNGKEIAEYVIKGYTGLDIDIYLTREMAVFLIRSIMGKCGVTLIKSDYGYEFRGYGFAIKQRYFSVRDVYIDPENLCEKYTPVCEVNVRDMVENLKILIERKVSLDTLVTVKNGKIILKPFEYPGKQRNYTHLSLQAETYTDMEFVVTVNWLTLFFLHLKNVVGAKWVTLELGKTEKIDPTGKEKMMLKVVWLSFSYYAIVKTKELIGVYAGGV